MFVGTRVWASLGGSALLWLTALSGCNSEFFACSDDAGCGGTTPGGVCEPSGFCSFPDDDCASGRRYGAHAGAGLGSTCVDEPDGTSTTGVTSAAGPTTADPPQTSAPGDDTTGLAPSTGAAETTTTGEPACSPDWWDCSHGIRQQVVLLGIPLGAPVTGLPFPARIDAELLDDPSLVFVDGNGDPLPWERDGDVTWISVDIEPDTPRVVWAYADGPARPDLPRVVWGPEFEAVWHLSTGDDASDNNPAEPDGVGFEGGYFGDAARFDGIDDLLRVPASESLADLRDDGFTIEVRLFPDTGLVDGARRIFEKADSTVASVGWSFLLEGVTPDHRMQLDLGFSEGEQPHASEIFPSRGWFHVAVTVQPDGALDFWLDGVKITHTIELEGSGSVVSDAEQPASIGALLADNGEPSNRYYSGLMDELRISRGPRSDDWMVATYVSGRPDAVSIEPAERRDQPE